MHLDIDLQHDCYNENYRWSEYTPHCNERFFRFVFLPFPHVHPAFFANYVCMYLDRDDVLVFK